MSHTRRDFLRNTTAAFGTLAFANSSRANTTPRRPNIVLIMTDDQGYGDLSCHGNPHLNTPNLDRLHRESVRLTDFHVSPTCAPSRAALLTGKYNNRVGVWHTIMGRSILRRGEQTLADHLADAGYRNGIFGKWHLGDNYPYRPQERGFHETLIHGGGGVGQSPDYWGNDYFDDTYWHNGTPTAFEGYCTDVWFNNALRFVESNREQPFFCYIPTNAPHFPYHVAAQYSQPFLDKGLPEPQARFYGMLQNFDENMGRLLDHLDRLELTDDTIVIFMTDNGTSEGELAGMRERKGSEYEGGHRVPCFIRWPKGGLSGGRDISTLAAHFDLLPTLLDCCQVPLPTGAALDGINLRPWLEATQTPEPERAIIVDSQRIETPEKWRKSAVMEKHWRLINGAALYNLQKDPAQNNDIAAAHPEVVAALRARYEASWDDVSTTFDQYCPIVLGAAEAKVQVLNSHDWHGEFPAWNQPHILKGAPGNGFWAVELAVPGTYQFNLRRWPVEASAPIRGALTRGTALDITEARIRIGDVEHAAPVGEAEHEIRFSMELPAGETRLQTWFTCADGKERGAYYVIAERLG